MRQRLDAFIIVAFWAVLVLGCENTFSPKGTYEERLVAYSILSNRSDTQYVRLYTTYDPPAFDPLANITDTPVTDAIVNLTTDSVTVQLSKTVMARPDRSRYPTDLDAYVAYPLAVVPGNSYELRVQSPSYGTFQAAVTVPGTGSIELANFSVLGDPTKMRDDLAVRVRLSPISRGFLVRFFLEYEVAQNGTWVSKRALVPETVDDVVDCQTFRARYPRLTRRTTPGETFNLVYQNLVYQLMIGNIRATHKPDSVKLKSAHFELIQAEHHFYSYFNVVNGFQDEVSIRPDEPDYSNISGRGLGVFGAFVVQSVSYQIPNTLGEDWTCM